MTGIITVLELDNQCSTQVEREFFAFEAFSVLPTLSKKRIFWKPSFNLCKNWWSFLFNFSWEHCHITLSLLLIKYLGWKIERQPLSYLQKQMVLNVNSFFFQGSSYSKLWIFYRKTISFMHKKNFFLQMACAPSSWNWIENWISGKKVVHCVVFDVLWFKRGK